MKTNEQIEKYITSFPDWQNSLLSQLRILIHTADPEIQEEWKWDVPVFIHEKMICAISAFKDHVKINFFKGALLSDPHKLINNGLESKLHRAIDFSQGDKIDEKALIELIKEAVMITVKKGGE